MGLSTIFDGLRHGSLIGAVAVLAACATAPATPELAVRERATQSWQAKAANDYDKAYTFMPPSYRAVTTVAKFKSGFGGAVRVTSAEVVGVVCETADKCTAEVRLEGRAGLMRSSSAPIVTFFEEVWIREAGQWWLFPTT